MLCQYGRFFATSLIAIATLSSDAVAVPTIKKLGPGTNATTTKSSQIKLSTPEKIAPSVANDGAVAVNVAPATTDTRGANVVSNVAGTTADSARLPGFFYGNIIKGIGTKLSSNYAQPSNGQSGGGNTSDLTQRINNLEEALDAKQETLKSGNGIYIDGKTIGLSQEMADLPGRVEEINQEIDELHDKFSGTDFEHIQQIIDNIQHNTTIYDSGTQEYKSVTIVDSFDEQDFIDKQQGSVK